MKIYFVNGIGTAGKDTFVDYVIQAAEADQKKIAKISTIDEVEKIALEHFGWNGRKDEKARKFLSAIKAAWGEYNNGPIVNANNVVIEAEHYEYCAIFIMVREYPEIMKMQKLMGGETINIIRSGITPGPTEKAFLDMVPTDYKYDLTIYNDASIEAWKRVSEFFYEKRVKRCEVLKSKSLVEKQIPNGQILVPIKPTKEMYNAGEKAFTSSYMGTPANLPRYVWEAMINASPEYTPNS